jgi:hypothetical protein
MIKAPGMLMVGTVDRNAGKTKFACSLITKFSSQCDIIGIKVSKKEQSCRLDGFNEKNETIFLIW